MDYNDDIMYDRIDGMFVEDTTYKKTTSYIPIAMGHLLKIKYCTNSRNYVGWYLSVKDSLVETYKSICKDKQIKLGEFLDNDKYGKFFNENMSDFYNDGIKIYKEAMKTYPDLKQGWKYIPAECPWTFSQLMNALFIDDDNDFAVSIKELLNKLPDMK